MAQLTEVPVERGRLCYDRASMILGKHRSVRLHLYIVIFDGDHLCLSRRLQLVLAVLTAI